MNNVDKKLQRNKYNCKQNEACNVTAAKPWSDFATGDEPLKMQLITLLLFFCNYIESNAALISKSV